MTATSMPGTVHIEAEDAFAVRSFSGVSSRLVGLPMSLKSFGSFSFTSSGGVKLRQPLRRVRRTAARLPESPWMTWLFSAWQVAGIDFPRLRGRGDEHRPRRRACFAQAVPFGPRARAAAGHLDAERQRGCRPAIDRRVLGADLAPIGIELLRDEQGERGVGALAHLGMIDDDGDDVVGADAHEGVRERTTLAGLSRSCRRLRELRAGKRRASVRRRRVRCDLRNRRRLRFTMSFTSHLLAPSSAAAR